MVVSAILHWAIDNGTMVMLLPWYSASAESPVRPGRALCLASMLSQILCTVVSILVPLSMKFPKPLIGREILRTRTYHLIPVELGVRSMLSAETLMQFRSLWME